MSLKRSIRLLSSSERQILKTQWLRSGRCARCFHASIRQRAENSSDGSDAGAPYNAPKRGPTRHERSAKVSNEISMLQKGPPPSGDTTGPSSVSGSYHAPPQAPRSSAGFLETPNDMGGPTRMGENVSAGREGPNAQGVGRPIRYEDRGDAPQDTTNQARGVRASGAVEEPVEGGASVLGGSNPDAGHHQEWIARSAREEDHDKDRPWNIKQENSLRNKITESQAMGIPIRPRAPSSETLLHDSAGASTIAAKNYLGVIRDRAHRITISSSTTQEPKNEKLAPDTREALIAKFVRGTYDPENYFGGEKFQQGVLNEVVKKTMLNGTYLQRDAERVVRKVRSLLPVAPTQQKQARK